MNGGKRQNMGDNLRNLDRFAKQAKLYGALAALAGQISTIAETYEQTYADLRQAEQKRPLGPQRLARAGVMFEALELLLLAKVEEMGELELKVEPDVQLPPPVFVRPPLPAGTRF